MKYDSRKWYQMLFAGAGQLYRLYYLLKTLIIQSDCANISIFKQ